MHKQCTAINLSNRKQCKRTDTTQYTTPDGVVRDSVCTKHIEQLDQGKSLTFVVDGEIRPTHAVLNNEDGSKTLVNLKDGEETTQLTLPNSKEETTVENIEVSVRPVVEVLENRIMVLQDSFRFVGTLEAFKARCRERLTQDPINIIGFCARLGNEILLVTEEKAVKVTWTVATVPATTVNRTNPRNMRNRPTGSGTKVERKPGYVCGNCSHWDSGTYVEVRHNTMDDVQACFSTNA